MLEDHPCATVEDMQSSKIKICAKESIILPSLAGIDAIPIEEQSHIILLI